MKDLRIEIKWGVILAAITFIVFSLSYVLGWQTNETLGMHLSAAFGAFLLGNLACLFMGLKEKREKALNGQMSLMDGFKAGAIITVTATVFGVLFLFFFTCCVNTGFLETTTEFQVANGLLEEGGVVTQGGFLQEFGMHSLLIGLVFSLIMAFILKKVGK